MGLFSRSRASKFSVLRNGNDGANSSYEPYRQFDNTAEPPVAPSDLPSQRDIRRYEARRASRRIFGFMNFISALASLAIVGVLVKLVIMLENSANTRLMWPHGMMNKAWPTTGAKTLPLYFLLAAAGLTAMVNIVAFMISLCTRITTWSTFQNVFSIIMRVITTGALSTGVVLLAVLDPNLRSWSCSNKYLESEINDNVIGFEQTCTQLSAVLAVAIFNALLEGFSVVEAIYHLKFKGRKVKSSGSGSFPRQLKIYERVDPAAREQDEVPMLNVDRKSRDLDRSAPVDNEPEDEWNASMLEVGRGSMQ